MKLKLNLNYSESFKERCFKEAVRRRYAIEKNELNKAIESLKGLPQIYKELYPSHYLSYYNLRKFLKEVSRLQLLPTEEEYIKINTNNEFFDLELKFFIGESIHVKLQYPLNINKVTSLIKEKNIKETILDVSTLEKIIRKPCFDDFDSDMQAKKDGLDCQEKIKALNPIILLDSERIVAPYVINGNHRVIQSIRDKKQIVHGYIITESLIEYCGITADYQKLYSLAKDIPAKIYNGKYVTNIV